MILECISSDSAMMRGEGVKHLITQYFDPFFVLSLWLKGDTCMIFFMVVMFLKFGLAGLAMERLLGRRFALKPFWCVLLSVIYPFSSVSVISSCSMALMNLVILYPLLFKAFDEAVAPGRRFIDIRCVSMCALVYASGINGLIQGLFASVFFAVFISFVRFRKASGVMRAFSAIILNCILGLVITSAVNFPRFMSLNYESLPATLFEDGEMKFSLFDMFSSTVSGLAVDSSLLVVPSMYIGVITMILVFIFFVNRSIPLRLKMMIMVVTVVFYASCSYTPIVSILSFTRLSIAGPVARLSAFVVILFAIAAISVRNLMKAGRNAVYISAFFMIAVVVISNSSDNAYGYMNYQLFVTILSAIGIALFLLSYIGGVRKNVLTAFGILAAATLFLNTSYVLMMSAVDDLDYKDSEYLSVFDYAQAESDMFLSVVNDTRGYVVVCDDALVPDRILDPAVKLNHIARAMMIDDVFAAVDTEEVSNKGFEYGEDGIYTVTANDDDELVIRVDCDEDVYVSSGFRCEAELSAPDRYFDLYPAYMAYSGPFIKMIPAGEEGYDIHFEIIEDGGFRGCLNVYTMAGHELEKIMDMTGDIGNGKFSIDDDMIPQAGGNKSIITGLLYDDNIRVEVQGIEYETFDCMGMLAIKLGSTAGGAEVEIIPATGGVATGIALTVLGVLCMVVLYCIPDKNRNGGIIYA